MCRCCCLLISLASVVSSVISLSRPCVVEKAQKDKGTNPLSAGCLLQPPTPIFRGDNWPTLEVQKTTLEDLSAAQGGAAEEEEYEDAAEAPAAAAAGELIRTLLNASDGELKTNLTVYRWRLGHGRWL